MFLRRANRELSSSRARVRNNEKMKPTSHSLTTRPLKPKNSSDVERLTEGTVLARNQRGEAGTDGHVEKRSTARLALSTH